MLYIYVYNYNHVTIWYHFKNTKQIQPAWFATSEFLWHSDLEGSVFWPKLPTSWSWWSYQRSKKLIEIVESTQQFRSVTKSHQSSRLLEQDGPVKPGLHHGEVKGAGTNCKMFEAKKAGNPLIPPIIDIGIPPASWPEGSPNESQAHQQERSLPMHDGWCHQ